MSPLEWAVWGNLFLSQTWKEFWPETRKRQGDGGMDCFLGATSTSESWPWSCPACFAPSAPAPPSTNPTMPHWHDWYEENCAFYLNPGHTRMIKNSSFQKLRQINGILIQVSSSRMQPLHFPTAKQTAYTSLRASAIFSRLPTQLSSTDLETVIDPACGVNHPQSI